jgi:diguanylate cyclase (GGDEF)-like protein/PAS domain S-box-containing protein
MARLSTEQEEAIRWLEIHRRISAALAGSDSLVGAADSILESLVGGLGVAAARLSRVDGPGGLWPVSLWPRGGMAFDAGLAARVLETGAPARSCDGFAFAIASSSGVLGVIELAGVSAGEPPPELDALCVPLGWQLGERIERERAEERARLREDRLARSEALLREAEQAAGSGSFERDLETGHAEYSEGMCRVLGVPAGVELTTELLLDHVHPDDRALLRAHLVDSAFDDPQPFDFEVRVRRFDGAERIMRTRGQSLVNGGGVPARVAGTVQDVTDEVEARAAQELLSNVVASSDDAIITAALDGTITSWNRGAERLYGYSAEEAVGQPLSLVAPRGRLEEQDGMRRKVSSGEPIDHLETEQRRKDGSSITVSVTISPVRDARGAIVSQALIARDVTERVRYEERLRHLADHDQLTGLSNRGAFEQELKRELARAGRHGLHGAVLSIDVDNFKSINDSAGHAAGDAVLAEVAAVLRERFRASDVVARLGGDEFGVLLPSVEPREARAVAEDLVHALRIRPAAYGGKPFRISLSVGVAPFESDDATASEVLVNADLAMYAAKTGGRDRVVLYTPSEARSARAMAKLTWSQRIQDALDRDRFVLHLQPILELASGRVRHGELLLRMRGDRGKLIAPGAFLPAAERFGLIHAIDRWVVQQAIELIAGSGPQHLDQVSVNLSGESVVGDSHLLDMIEQSLADASVDPSRLIFEITETAAIANMTEATRFAKGLTGLGCSLALDDFGTGFGSFYYLKHLPVRYVKMDGEFIQNLPRSQVDEHMVRAIVGVAQGLGIKTVAESVADDETIRLLLEHGVDYAQGFYVGKPEPVAAGLR